MPYCTKCGAEISDHQFQNYKGMCSQCARLSAYSSKESGKSMVGYGIFFLFISIWFIFIGIMAVLVGETLLIFLLLIGFPLFIVGILMIVYGIKKKKSL